MPAPIRYVVAEMVDLGLLTVPDMALLFASNILAMLGFYVPYVYLTGHAEANGVRDFLKFRFKEFECRLKC